MSSFKELNISNPGTSSKYGGDDTDLINKLFNGVVAGIPAVKVKSQNKFGFWDGIAYIRNQPDTKNTTIRGQSNTPTTDVDLRLPPITGNDVLPALNLEQAFLKKQQFNLGMTLQEMAAPTQPSATFHHLYMDTTTKHLVRKDSAGVLTDYDEVLNGGSGGPGNYTYLIQKIGSNYYAKNSVGNIVNSNPYFHTLINAVIASCANGDTVALAPGTYTTIGSIIIQKNNFTLLGIGKAIIVGAVEIIKAGNMSYSITAPFPAADYVGIKIKNITFDFDGVNPPYLDGLTPWYGIWFSRVDYPVLEDCEIRNMSTACLGGFPVGSMRFIDCKYGLIARNHVHDCTNGVGLTEGCSHFRITQNLVENSFVYTGIIIYQTIGYHTIDNNICRHCKDRGINIDGGADTGPYYDRNMYTTVANNVCEGMIDSIGGFNQDSDGIQNYASFYCTFVGNTCSGNAAHGIKFYDVGAFGSVVSGNVCKGNTLDGIHFYNSRYSTVNGNLCEGNARHGMQFLTISHDNQVSANILSTNGNNGIRVDATAQVNINGNYFINNGQTTHNTYADVLLINTSGRNRVTNNMFITELANKTKYSIEENAAVDNDNNLLWNYLSPLNSLIKKSGPLTRVRGNIGWTTENSGVSSQNGNGSTKVFNIAHGLRDIPTKYVVNGGHIDSIGPFYVTVDATNIIVTFPTAPQTGTNNVVLTWIGEVRI